MRPALTSDEFINRYRRQLKLRSSFRQVEQDRHNSSEFDRLGQIAGTRGIPDQEFAEATLLLAHGSNLAPRVEAAARNQLLQISGYDSTQAFINRQNQAITQDERTAS